MSDQTARLEAINLRKSFIVQAPAGSGKTELLIQRYLAALADARIYPEEVLAITFTKKAASEMQARIVNAMLIAKTGIAPADPHSLKTFQLAQMCLIRSQKLNWDIVENQHRICVMTIDSLCHKINKEAASFVPEPHPTPYLFYQTVVQDFVNDLKEEHDQDFADCLLYFANQSSWLEQLFCESLATRDQWLPLIFQHTDPAVTNSQYIEAIWQPLLDDFDDILTNVTHIINDCLQKINFTKTSGPNYLKAIANLLLTSKGTTRASFTKKQGFQPAKELNKAEQAIQNERKQLLKELANNNLKYWRRVQLAPIIEDPELLLILPKLLGLLQKLIAYLKFHFQNAKTTDFIEQTATTTLSLQHSTDWPDTPGVPRPGTIRHILLDEFQDTAKPQLLLLEGLMMHFDSSADNSVFIVGDPMQSIYRFRQADVGLFYKVIHSGICDIKLDFLQLSSNFRSNLDLITYFNGLFPNIFPQASNPRIGAVPYHPAKASNDHNSIIDFRAFADQKQQMQAVLEICKQHNDCNIGILVRSRAIAEMLLPYLHELEVNEHGLKPSAKAPETDDLLCITEFLLNPYDNNSCAAILRSRLIGFSMQELYLVCEYGSGDCLLESLSLLDSSPKLKTIKQQYSDLIAALIQAVKHDHGLTLTEKTQALWQAISPIAAADLITAQISWQYFEHLATAEKIAPFAIIPALNELLQSSVSLNNSAKINIMTIHKSKGLEFDVVIMPCLEKTIASRSGKLLWWEQTEDNFLWLPNHPNQNAISSAHEHVYSLESAREQQEKIRLLYVAMTRARQHLYGLAAITDKPTKNSFADLIWNWVNFQESCVESEQELTARLEYFARRSIRLQDITKTSDVPSFSAQPINGIAWHYCLFLFLSKQTDIIPKLKLYLYEQNFSESEVIATTEKISQLWQLCKTYDFIKWLAAQTKVWPEYELMHDNNKLIIDAVVFDTNKWLIIDFKTNTNVSQVNLVSWYQQTDKYREVLARQLGITNKAINLVIYNPIKDCKYIENGGGYVQDACYTSIS